VANQSQDSQQSAPVAAAAAPAALPPILLRQQQINAGIVALANADLGRLWANVDWESPQAAQAVKTFYGHVVTQYGQSSATVAAMFYDELRAAADAPGQFTASPAEPIPQPIIDKIVASAFLGSAPQQSAPEPEQPVTTSELPLEQRVPQRLDATAERLIRQPGRDTIAQNTVKDPGKPRWIRVPEGPNPCAFCIMMASRALNEHFGGYSSEKAAGGEGNKYHDRCRCEPVPIFPGENFTDYSPNQPDFLLMYQKAAADAGSHSDTKAILASMRTLFNVK
jgi:hypothetical protein